MKSNTPLSIKAFIFTPAIIELILISVCIIVSGAVLAYEIYSMIMDTKNKRRIKA
jgi:phage shock protein PspC (stress-responsive transcriptional regulator)